VTSFLPRSYTNLSRFSTISVLVCAFIGIFHRASAQDAVPAKISLAAYTPQNAKSSHSSDTNIFLDKTGSKDAYNAQLLALSGLIMSDDSGLYKTVQVGSNSTTYKAAKDVTHLGELTYAAPIVGAVYLIGGHRNRDIAWRSGVAVLKAGAVGLLVKELAGRERPQGQTGGSADTFKPFGGSKDDYQSFPSGHTLVAFSIATVWAGEEPKERYAAYGLASLVGLSRVIVQAHWPSDVFWGAVLGVTQGRQALHGNTNLVNIRF
jgi:membrane-associated phospholipid phosphatase